MQTVPTPFADWIIILPVVLPLIAGGLLLMFRHLRELHWMTGVAVTLAVLLLDIELFRRTLITGPMSMTMGNWLPPFGISFTADAMSAGFALASALVALVVMVYLAGDEGEQPLGVHALILLLLAGVSGSFLTGDLFNLYVWFEVMLIASFGLMSLRSTPLQLDGTVKYGFLNFLATTFFLLALGLIYGLLGTLNMADIALRAGGADPAAMAGIAAMLVLAFGIKAAAFPVNAWLPASYHAPSAAISALLAGLLTKVGIYALLRVLILLMPATREVLGPVVATIAVLTLIVGPLGAIAETNLRRALGFLVIGGIGAVMLGLALPNANGLAGAATYVLHSMLTMAGLFLVAGLVERATGETDTRRMGGLYAANAPLSILFLVLVLAVSGVPPFLGFWPKLLLLEGGIDASRLAGSGLDVDWIPAGMALALLVNALLTLIAGTRLWAHIFWRAGLEGETSEVPNEQLRPIEGRGAWLSLGAAVALTGIIFALGLVPGLLLDLGRSAAIDLLNPASYIDATGPVGSMP